MNTYFNVLPVGGLGNRLLAVLSATRVARRRGLTPRVFWMPDSECQCAWSDLFGLDIATTDAAPQTLIDRSFAAYEGWRINVPPQTLPRDNDDFSVFSNTVFLDDNEVRHPFRHQGHQLATFADELSALQPLALIENDVRQYVAGRNFADMLGIHIRRGHQDANFDTEWMKSVPIDGYRRMAEAALKMGRRVHVCSDDERVVELFKAEFDASVFPVRSRDKNTDAAAIQDALKDMLVMSHCSHIISLYGSTFGYLSAVLGKTKLVCILDPKPALPVLDQAIDFGRYDRLGRAERAPLLLSA